LTWGSEIPFRNLYFTGREEALESFERNLRQVAQQSLGSRPKRDLAVLGPVEHRAPGLELPDAVRGLLGVQFGHPPVVEELAASLRVAVVDLPVVVRVHVAHGGGAAALGHHGVRLAEQGLGDDRGFLPLQTGLDRRAQPGAARADDR